MEDNFEIISGNRKITLNRCQQDFIHLYRKWRKSDSQFMCLNGGAGTGKTTCVKYAIKGDYSVTVSAPSHKAKKVVAKATGIKGQTIQKIVGLKPATDLEEFSNKNLLFAQSGNCTMSEYNLVIIDEASMINNDLVRFIKEQAVMCGTKVLFMGDINQLPPVHETLGLVFSGPEIWQFNLTIVERQKFGNPLLDLHQTILSDIHSHKDLYERKTNMNGNLGYSFMSDMKEYSNLVINSFDPGTYCNNKILAWSNKRVRGWNNSLRRKIITDQSAPIVVGEYLMAYRTTSDLTNWKVTVLENSCDYKVCSISPDSRDQRYWDKGSEKEKMTVIFGYDVLLQNMDDEGVFRNVFVVDPQSYDIFSSIDVDKYTWASSQKGAERSRAWAVYYQFRNQYVLIGDIIDDNGSKLSERDLDYYYAQTAHKSQGSTYDNVFIDEENLNQFFDYKMTQQEVHTTRNKLKYVAMSRPTDAAFMYFKD